MTLQQIPMFRDTCAASSRHAYHCPPYVKVSYVCSHFENYFNHI